MSSNPIQVGSNDPAQAAQALIDAAGGATQQPAINMDDAAQAGQNVIDNFNTNSALYNTPQSQQSQQQPQKQGGLWNNIKAGMVEGLAGLAGVIPGYEAGVETGSPTFGLNGLNQSYPIPPSEIPKAAQQGMINPLGFTDPNAISHNTWGEDVARGLGQTATGLPFSLPLGDMGLLPTVGRLAATAAGSVASTSLAHAVPDKWKPGVMFAGNLLGSLGYGLTEGAATAGIPGLWSHLRGTLGVGPKESINVPGAVDDVGNPVSVIGTKQQLNNVGQRIYATGGDPLVAALNDQDNTGYFSGDNPTTGEIAQRANIPTANNVSAAENAARIAQSTVFKGRDAAQDQAKLNAVNDTAPHFVDNDAVSNVLQGHNDTVNTGLDLTRQGAEQYLKTATAPLTQPVNEEALGLAGSTALQQAQQAAHTTASDAFTNYSPPVGARVNTVPAWSAASAIAQNHLADPHLSSLASPVRSILTRFLGKQAMTDQGIEWPQDEPLEGIDAPIRQQLSVQETQQMLTNIRNAQSRLPVGSPGQLQLKSIKDALTGELTKVAPNYQVLRNNWNAFKQQFSSGIVGALLRTEKGLPTNPRVVQNSQFWNQVRTPEDYRALVAATNNDPAIPQSFTMHLLGQLSDKGIIDPNTGIINLSKFQAWRQANAPLLNQLPGSAKTLDNAESAQNFYDTTMAAIKQNTEAASDKVAGQFLADDPENAVRMAMTGPTGPQKLMALEQQISAARGATIDMKRSAFTSLQRFVVNNILSKFSNGKFEDAFGNIQARSLKQDPYNAFLTMYRAPLKRLLGKPELGLGGGQGYQNLFMVGKAIRAEQDNLASSRTVPGSPTAAFQQNVTKQGMNNQGHNESLTEAGHGFGWPLLFSQIGEHMMPEGGSMVGIAAGLGMNSMRQLMSGFKQAGIKTQNDIYALSMRYPALAKVLMERPNGQTAMTNQWRSRLLSEVRSATMNDLIRQSYNHNE